MNTDLMKSRFAVPIAVAVAVHAILLFGFTSGGMKDPPDPKTDPKPHKYPPLTEVSIEEPPQGAGDEPAGGRKSPSSGHPVTLPDLPGIARSEADFLVPITTILSGPVDLGLSHPPTGPLGLDGGGGEGDGPGLFRPIDLDEPPRVKFSMRPEYPYAMRTAGAEGVVVVDFIVDESGRVTSPRVMRSSHAGFDEATLRAVAKWRFEPGKRRGVPVRFRMQLPLVFSLGDGK